MPKNSLHFSISERKLYLRFFDIVFTLVGLFGIGYLVDFQYFNFYNSHSVIWVILLAFYLLFFGEIFEMYNLKVASDIYLTFKSTLITVGFTILFYVFTPIISPILPQNRIQIVYFGISLLLPILVGRFIYIQFIFSPRFLKNILVIAEPSQFNSIISLNKETNNIAAYISNDEIEKGANIPFYLAATVDIEEIVKTKFINEILVSSKNMTFIEKLNKQLIVLFEKGVVIRSIDNFIEEETNHISETQLTTNFYNNFTFSKSHQNNLYLTFKRILDVIFSIFGIFIFALLVPLVFLVNRFGNKGKLIYTQQRIGKRGKVFKIIKFRTMITNAEDGGAKWAEKNDARITPFGRVLRRSRLDEVPQFINVLKGDMSLIGPRPERPEFVKQLEEKFPFYAIRHVIKPGLTGWAQVKHPYANTIEDQHKKLMYDLYYIKERNLIMDLKIVIKTISTIVFFRGT